MDLTNAKKAVSIETEREVRVIFLVPYAYDRMPQGQPRVGVPAKRLGTKARCDALLEKVDALWKADLRISGRKFCFILTAGFCKESPNSPKEGAEESLSMQMAKYLCENSPLQVRAYSLAWGTYQETLLSRNLIKNIVRSRGAPNAKIYISTNLGHLPRVWLCWRFLKPSGWEVRFVRAKHSFKVWPEYFQETFKFFLYLYRFLLKKW